MKTFFNLVQEVLKPGLCSGCGGCTVFCTAMNYGALEMNENGNPAYRDMGKCIECGLCYSICPEIKDLDDEIKQQADWDEPLGKMIETTVVRASDKKVRDLGTEAGALTGLLLHLFDRNRIDGVIVTRPAGKYLGRPFLAITRKEILDSAGLFFDSYHPMKQFGEHYMTLSTIEEFDSVIKKDLRRLALVGTPCQIKSIRKMQALSLVPSDTIKFCFGVFCSGIFPIGVKEQQKLADIVGIVWEDVARIDMKHKPMITLMSGETKTMEFEQIESIKRSACQYCPDYSAEFADISFGGIGASDGWTTVIARTPVGRGILVETLRFDKLEQFRVADDPEFAGRALQTVRKSSSEKKKKARHERRKLQAKPVQVQV